MGNTGKNHTSLTSQQRLVPFQTVRLGFPRSLEENSSGRAHTDGCFATQSRLLLSLWSMLPGIWGLSSIEKDHSGRCILTSKTSVAHATGVVDDERGHFLFGHVCRNGRTERGWAIFAPLTDIWFATQTKQRKSCK